MSMKRRLLLSIAAPMALAACGFRLRGVPNFAFKTIHVVAPEGSGLAAELRQTIGSSGAVQVVGVPAQAEVVIELTADQREKVVVGLSAAGQVREFQLRIRLKFKLRTPQGKELIAETELLQQRDISFNESAVLAKEQEEALLYRDMQTDLVQQLMRRLAAIKAL
jgi:LPS-assembly lipoprotein